MDPGEPPAALRWWWAALAAAAAVVLVALAMRRERQRALVARDRAWRRALALEEQQAELQRRAAKASQALEPAPQRRSVVAGGHSESASSSPCIASASQSAGAGDTQEQQQESERAAADEKRLALARRTGLLNFLPRVLPSEQIASLAPHLRALSLAEANVKDADVRCLSQVPFPSLATLELTANRLSVVWPAGACWQMPLLDRLNLSRNPDLDALPESGWAGMTRLRELHVSTCALTALPPSLGELASLRLLDVSRNQLASAPHELGALHALKDLDMSCNHVECLPIAWAGMTQLRRLNVENNRLTGCPREILDLDALGSGTTLRACAARAPCACGALAAALPICAVEPSANTCTQAALARMLACCTHLPATQPHTLSRCS